MKWRYASVQGIGAKCGVLASTDVHHVLTMLGERTLLPDASGGLATHMSKGGGPTDALFVRSFRFYATKVVNVAEETAGCGVPVLAITDGPLSP